MAAYCRVSSKEFYFNGAVQRYPNGDKMHTVIILFEALRVKGELRIHDGESKKLKFFSLDKLPEMVLLVNKNGPKMAKKNPPPDIAFLV